MLASPLTVVTIAASPEAPKRRIQVTTSSQFLWLKGV
jgi:hypothetical protein